MKAIDNRIMKYLKLLLFLIFIIGVNEDISAQKIKPLMIDENVPDYPLNNLINYPSKNTKLTDFRGKVLILDFWTFGCTACIESWPKLMKLQEQFKDKIQIILVNVFENKQNVQAFLDKRETLFGYKMSLPVACGDKALRDFFPFQAVPYVVYIDQMGKIKYFSSGAYQDPKMIQDLIEGIKLAPQEEIENYPPISYNKPMFIDGNGDNGHHEKNVIYSSLISPRSPNIFSTVVFGQREGTSYGCISNFPIKDMLRVLYGKGRDSNNTELRVPNSQLFFKTDSSKFVGEINHVPKPENRNTIQVTVRKQIPIDTLKSKMIKDLETCFEFKTKWEKQTKSCLVITIDSSRLIRYKTGSKVLRIGKIAVHLNQVTIQDVFARLLMTGSVYAAFPYPILDETDFKGKLGEINFETNVNDYHALGEQFAKYGINFSIKAREVDVLVIYN
jgi:thiol-disulfide isomerase/thioredoxin